MFVPIDRLKPILADLIADGRTAGPVKPWLGINTEEFNGRLFITRVSPESPAAKAGLKRGDMIVGVGGETAKGLAELYRQIYARGNAGVPVPLTVLQGAEMKQVTIQSEDRRNYLKLKSSF
jgi:S1-C subfamily serine protease